MGTDGASANIARRDWLRLSRLDMLGVVSSALTLVSNQRCFNWHSIDHI